MTTKRFRTPFLVAALCVASLAHAREPATDIAKLVAELGLKESATAARDLPGWRAPKHIVVARHSAEEIAALQAVAPHVELHAAAQGEALARQLAEADGVIGLCDAPTLAAAPKLHWIQALSAKIPTRVNGDPVTRAVLKDGDVIALGEVRLRLRLVPR